uniref:39S ribosomal protein L30, mitochondrial n=1 Tax=Meloidogyne incognita TaxID=6306 RepID=A0A914KS15_MELIC
MAKVIRQCWVWRKNNRVWRYLPRRDDRVNRVDLDVLAEQCETFPDPMPVEPPKLWVAWIFRDLEKSDGILRDHVRKLFGKYPKPGELHIFMNTLANNKQLWKIKHLIEIRPISFPNGEPGPEDVYNLEVMADGRCIIDENLADPRNVQLLDPTKQFTKNYLMSKLRSKDARLKEIYEDTVYNPENISIC